MTSAATYRNEIRASNAANFVQELRTNNSGTGIATKDNQLYAVIGREDDPAGTDQAGSPFSAGAGLWVDEQNPPVPTSKLDDMQKMWCMAIGASKVSPADVTLVVPRINWTTGTPYVVPPLNDATWYADSDFYVVTDLNEVWVCVVAGGGNSTTKPVRSGGLAVDSTYYKDGTSSIYVSGGDGYSWKYLYTLTTYQASTLLDESYLPVPIGDSLWTPSSDPQRTQGSDLAAAILNARLVMVRVFLTAGNDGSGLLPSGLNYRQLALVENPVLSGGGYVRATGSTYHQANTINGSTNQLVKYSGQMVYLENRGPISRENNQSEEYRVVLGF